MEDFAQTQVISAPEKARMLVDLHIAEYQMLTNRCTYWLAIQYGLWTLFAVCMSIIAAAWGHYVKMHDVLLWVSLAVSNVMVLLQVMNTKEYYYVVLYIEETLYSEVKAIGVGPGFWNYENYLKNKRLTFVTKNFEFILPLLSSVVLIAISFWCLNRHFWGIRDVAFLFFNIIFCAYLWINSSQLIKIRKRFSVAKEK